MQGNLDDLARARAGSVIKGKYRLERLIGSGGMASVYEAVHRNGHRVAIKMLHPHLSIDADLRARFLREGYVANKVNHRGAVRVLDDDTAEDGAAFLVMELLEGETLDALWERHQRRLAHRDVCQYAHQLLDVLAAAHDASVVHRDIKPENLFLTVDGVLKVLDFGIARLRDGPGSETATRTGRMIGTPAFMPPEQALGRSREIDGQTDLWAAGATMFTLLSGSFVHEAETMEEMVVHAAIAPARALATISPDAPPEIAAVIDRALAFAKEDRWPNARAMGAALAEAYRTTYGASLPQSRSSRPSGAPSSQEERVASSLAFAETVNSGAKHSSRHVPRPSSPAQPSPASDVRTSAGLSSSLGLAERLSGATPPMRKRASAAFWVGAVVVALLGASGTALVMRTRAIDVPIRAAVASSSHATMSDPAALSTAPVAPPASAATSAATLAPSAREQPAKTAIAATAKANSVQASQAPHPATSRPSAGPPSSASAPEAGSPPPPKTRVDQRGLAGENPF
jgi:eukaryotic-like serine/threonine-protein kinase